MRAPALAVAVLVALGAVAAADPPPGGTALLAISPREATVGDRLQATLTIDLPGGTAFSPPDLADRFGKLTLVSGSWSGPVEEGGRTRWTWSGSLAVFETGELEVPAIEIAALATEPVTLTIRSVLPPETEDGKPPDLSDLKPEVSITPNYGPLRKALAILGLLLAVAAAAWWLHRRYAAKLAAVPAPEDPFHRQPPHVWAYGELKRLLEMRLADEGDVDRFFSELARILKLYLGGRYRVELMEHTTSEVVLLLRQAQAPSGAIAEARALLEACDLVKFARRLPSPEACRKSVEDAYRIVDGTKPVEEAPEATDARGAA